MRPTIVIRCDGGVAIGMGHVVRCLALAQMLKKHFDIKFVIQETNTQVIELIKETTEHIVILPQTKDYKVDAKALIAQVKPGEIIVLDGYNFDSEYQQDIKNNKNKLVCIDDLISWHQYADIVINQALGISPNQYKSEAYTQFLLGLDYALLRAPLLQEAPSRNIKNIEKVFISMGAADANNITQKFTEALIKVPQIKEIHLMLGAVNPHLKSLDKLIEDNPQINIQKHINITASDLHLLLNTCDLAICPASSISLECCAVGIALVSGFTADNQKANLQGMESQKVLINLGDFNSLSIENIQEKMARIVLEPQDFAPLINNQKKLIDGRSSERILKAFEDLAQNKLTLRLAQEEDSELYFNWLNDDLVRQFSFNQDRISFDNHQKWFQSKLQSTDCFFYLFLDNQTQKPAGQVRIDKSNNEIVIGISIAENFRGKGLGKEMLRKAVSTYLNKFPDASIVAYIKLENVASYQLFKSAGFKNEELSSFNGSQVYKLYKSLAS